MALDPITGLPSSNTPSPAISATQLNTGVNPLLIPTVTQDTASYGNKTQAISDQIAGELKKYTDQQAAAEKARTDSASKMIDFSKLIDNKTADTAAANEITGVNTATTDINKYSEQLANLNGQVMSLNREAQAIPLQMQSQAEGRGITDAGLEPITTAALRNNAIKALSVAQQADVASANLTGSTIRLQAARDKAKEIVDLKYKPIEDALEREKMVYDLNKDYLSSVDKKRTEALTVALKKEEDALATKKAIETMIQEAAPFAPSDVIANAKAIFDKGGTKLQVAQALGKYGGDYLKNELTKEQIKSQISQQARDYSAVNRDTAAANKDNADAARIGAESGLIYDKKTGKYTPNPNAPLAGFKPLTEGQTKDLGYAKRIQDATPYIEKLGESIIGMDSAKFAAQMRLASSPLTSKYASPEVRQYYQAAQNFLTAKLRQESGATINPSEFKDAYVVYLPFPGDDAQTLAQKKQARDSVLTTFKNTIPNYDQRAMSTEDRYLDSVVAPVVNSVDETVNNPIKSYRMMLQGLPGTKQ